MQVTNQPVSRDGGFAAQTLSPEERERLRQFYADNGYVVLRDVVPKEGLSALRMRIIDEFDRVKRAGTLFSGGGTASVRRALQLVEHLPSFIRAASNRK